MSSEIVSQTPNWYILLCIALGLAFALFTYFRYQTLSIKQKTILSVLRGVLTFLVAYLLLNPLIKTITKDVIKPKVVLVLDNSKSMLQCGEKALKEVFSGVLALKESLLEKGFELELRSLSEEGLDDINNAKIGLSKTNLSAVLADLKNNYDGQNLSDVILISDGIINDGTSPTFQKYPFNIHTVGFGDTTVKKDIFISGIAANKLAYLGNKFTVNVDVSSFLLAGKATSLSIKDGSGKVLVQKPLNISKNEDFQTLSFELLAEKVGKQRYVAELKTVEGEFSLKNNVREFVVEVINGKEKILLLAFAPHPDLKAFKSIIEKNDLFELQTQILQSTDPSQIGKDPFDILILHQVPDAYGSSTGIVSTLLSKKKPTFFVVGSKTNISSFNGMQDVVGINAQLNKLDKVTAESNSSFQRFSMAQTTTELLDKLPPISVPFGEYKPFPG